LILRRLRIDGFGPLRGEWRFDPARVNLFVGENERGKTTFASAITAALFGLESDKRSYRDGRATPLDHYRPWANGRAYALELEFDLAGHRYVVTRNFATQRVTVLQDGRDTTEDFRHGSGEYKVGEELLGMSVEQFARSALALQPGPTRLGGADVRPDGALTTLLDAMASSVTGDASSADALRVLDDALRNFKGQAQVGLVANEIKKLQVAIETCNVELTAAESDRAQLADALARIADLEEREAMLDGDLAGARHANAGKRLAELRDKLAKDADDRAQIAAWSEERVRLEPARGIPRELLTRLNQAEAERVAARRTLDALAETRQREVTGPRAEIEGALAPLASFAFAEPSHIEELAGLEKDLARVAEQRQGAEAREQELTADLAQRGVTLERITELGARFGDISSDDRALLTQYPAQTQAIVVESDNAQRSVTAAQGAIDAVRAARGRLRTWGFVVGGLGLLAGGGAVWLAIDGRVNESFVGLGLTLLAVAAAVLLLLRSASHQGAERSDALRQMLDAQRRLGDLRTRRREREETLQALAGRLGFEDVTQLLREHGEHLRLTVENQRLVWLAEDRKRAAAAAAEAGTAVERWATRAGLPPGDEPRSIVARLRQGVGAVLDARSRGRELDQVDRRLATQEADAQARLAHATGEVADVARQLGLAPDATAGGAGGAPDARGPAPDPQMLAALAEQRAREHARLVALETEILPAAEARLLTDSARSAGAAELAQLEKDVATQATQPAPPASPAKDPAAIEQELARVRRERLELANRVGGRERDASARIMRVLGERESHASALERARRFKEAVELAKDRMQGVARETHARWSEGIATRVDELLTRFGLGHQSFQVSDKLEVSLTVNGDRLGQARLDQALSAGARDQVQLALRIAICEYLARGGERLPILLDDPLATSDDERTKRLFRTLAEAVHAGHQVIVLTCHRAKIDSARAADPTWFDGAVSAEAFA
jgi:hypothetical protein